jgi:hypothetical protein
LRNHRETIVAMDFFVVPTVTFRLVYSLVHDQPFTTTDSALRRDRRSDGHLGCPAATRDVRTRCHTQVLDL